MTFFHPPKETMRVCAAACLLQGRHIVSALLTSAVVLACVNVITREYPPSPSASAFHRVALCFLPLLSLVPRSETHAAAAAVWHGSLLRWLDRVMTVPGMSLGETQPPAAEAAIETAKLFLLVAVLGVVGDRSAVTAIIQRELRTDVDLSSDGFRFLAKLCTETLPQATLVHRVMALPVTLQLGGLEGTLLPIHCVRQLLCGRLCTKHQVQAHEWIIRQVCVFGGFFLALFLGCTTGHSTFL
jgi:hypothetical protein